MIFSYLINLFILSIETLNVSFDLLFPIDLQFLNDFHLDHVRLEDEPMFTAHSFLSKLQPFVYKFTLILLIILSIHLKSSSLLQDLLFIHFIWSFPIRI